MHITHYNPNNLLKVESDDISHYSTPLIVETLNTYLFNAIEPAFYASDKFKAQFICLIGVYHTDNRKQLASLPFNKIQTAFLSALYDKANFYRVRDLYIDRSIAYSQIAAFFKELEILKSHYITSLEFPSKANILIYQEHKRFLGLNADPVALYNELSIWLDLYVEFRNSIINNYIKFSFIKSMGIANSIDTFVDHNELYMNYLLAVNRAVDKCDKAKGTLTPYIMKWFLNAKSHPDFPHEYGVVYTIPNNQKIKRVGDSNVVNNFAESLHDEDVLNEIEKGGEDTPDFDETKLDTFLMRKLGRLKECHLAYMVMGFPIHVSAKQRRRLKQLSK